MKRLWCVLLLAIVFTSSVSFAEETLYVNVRYGSYLNAREFPDSNSRLAGRLERGRKAIVVETCDGFSRVLFVSDNKSGWVSSEFLSAEQPEIIPTGKYITTDKVILRKEPSKKSGSVMKLKKGKTVTVKNFFEDNDGVLWAEVNGGFINMAFLEPEQD